MMLSGAIERLVRLVRREPDAAFSSARYWEDRYARGGNSGDGSYGHLAQFKAAVINQYVEEHGIHSVIEFGCGDGNQLRLAKYPNYVGYDVSRQAVKKCRSMFREDRSKSFFTVDAYDGRTAELALSLDVIFHLVEDHVYSGYMARLFQAARHHVIIYSSNRDLPVQLGSMHVRHRQITTWIKKNVPSSWVLAQTVENAFPFDGDNKSTSFADFYIYQKFDR